MNSCSHCRRRQDDIARLHLGQEQRSSARLLRRVGVSHKDFPICLARIMLNRTELRWILTINMISTQRLKPSHLLWDMGILNRLSISRKRLFESVNAIRISIQNLRVVVFVLPGWHHCWFNFYRAMLRRARLCHSMSSVCLSVRGVCDVQVPSLFCGRRGQSPSQYTLRRCALVWSMSA